MGHTVTTTRGGGVTAALPGSDQHYTDLRYDYLERFSSYWYQIRETLSFGPRHVLEIGPGGHLFQDYLQRRGVRVTTLDIDPRNAPSVVGASRELPFADGAFDVAVAFQVLEHIPFEDFGPSLTEMRRVSRSGVVISIPDNRYHARLLLGAFTTDRRARLLLSFPRFLRRRLVEDVHLWEIGRTGFPLRKVNAAIPDGLHLARHYRAWENPFHHYYVLERR